MKVLAFLKHLSCDEHSWIAWHAELLHESRIHSSCDACDRLLTIEQISETALRLTQRADPRVRRIRAENQIKVRRELREFVEGTECALG